MPPNVRFTTCSKTLMPCQDIMEDCIRADGHSKMNVLSREYILDFLRSLVSRLVLVFPMSLKGLQREPQSGEPQECRRNRIGIYLPDSYRKPGSVHLFCIRSDLPLPPSPPAASAWASPIPLPQFWVCIRRRAILRSRDMQGRKGHNHAPNILSTHMKHNNIRNLRT